MFCSFYILLFSLFQKYILAGTSSKPTKARTPEGLIVCIHFLGPAWELVACLVHNNRGENKALIFICPYPTGNQASGQNVMKCLFRRHLARQNGMKFTKLICPQITKCSFQT